MGAADWATLLAGLEPPEARPAEPDYVQPFEFNAEPTSPSIDQYMRLTMLDGDPMILHLRFQRIYQPNIGEILYRESEQLRAKYHSRVESVVTLLWNGADGPALTGEHILPGGKTFHYKVVRLWEKDPEEMFNSSVNATLAPLARFEPERLPEILRRMEEAIETKSRNDEERENAWVIAYTHLGLRFPADRINELLAHRLPALCATPPFKRTRSTAYHAGYSDAPARGRPALGAAVGAGHRSRTTR